MTEQWYVCRSGGQPEGPYTARDILTRIALSELGGDARIAPAGTSSWRNLAEEPTFADAFTTNGTILFGPPAPSRGAVEEPSTPPQARASAERLPSPPPAPGVAVSLSPRTRPSTVLQMTARRVLLVAGLLLGVVLILVVTATIVGVSASTNTTVKSGVVRIVAATGRGSGFFVQGPDEMAYVVTAYHVVEDGGDILIQRDVETSDTTHYVEAYPEVEIVAFDADADLAILRIKNLARRRFSALPLAAAPIKDERIQSYGFPASNLTRSAGLVSKDGKVLSLAKFPVHDMRYQQSLREDAIDGVLVSSEIENGFSGGPTCNERGEVVGINIWKDITHHGQNGAVSVAALRNLLEQVTPVAARKNPSSEDVEAMLNRVAAQYLSLPVEERWKVRETELLSAGDLPLLRSFTSRFRRYERSTSTRSENNHSLTGAAFLGILFAKLPGKSLETYFSPITKDKLGKCEQQKVRIGEFWSNIKGDGEEVDPEAVGEACNKYAYRPLVWDLISATLMWDEREQPSYSVQKLEPVDPERGVYKVGVKAKGRPSSFDVWIATDDGRLRLKVFGENGLPYALDAPRSVAPAELAGEWIADEQRYRQSDLAFDIDPEEHLYVTFHGDRAASVNHVVHHRYTYSAGERRVFECTKGSSVNVGMVQWFDGKLEGGVLVAYPQRDVELNGDKQCELRYSKDKAIALKLSGSTLIMYRTDGTTYPEQQVFRRR